LLTARQEKNIFLSQTDLVNVIQWSTPTTGTPPIEYKIYRNVELTHLIGVVGANEKLKFKDYNRKKNKTYTYYIVSVDLFGNVSAAASITVTPE
jgi:hypothetical protein